MNQQSPDTRMALKAEREACAQLVADFARVWEPEGKGPCHAAAEAVRMRSVVEILDAVKEAA